MDKKVSQIHLSSDRETIYFLEVTWDKDLGSGFSLTLCDGQAAWTGKVSEGEISKDAADMEMDREKYVDELRKALIIEAAHTCPYLYDLTKDEGEGGGYLFSYDKNMKDVVFRLGSLVLRSVPSPAVAITNLISNSLNNSTKLLTKNEHLRRENERLLSDWNYMQGQLNEFVSLKEELEQDMYTRFTLVLNEKKAKIRSLQEKLKDVEEKLNRKAEDATQHTKEITEDYDGSTDEESKSQTLPSKEKAATLLRKDSSLSSTDDVTDIAPSRKRRHRVSKMNTEEATYTIQEATVQQKKRRETVPLKRSAKTPPSDKIALETSEKTDDPDDLFNDM